MSINSFSFHLIKTLVCIPGSDKPVDLLFVIDASGSIKDKWIDEIGFARRVLNLVNVHSQAVRVGLIQYSRRARYIIVYA